MTERPGELALPGLAQRPADAGLIYIGWLETPWRDRAHCPRNIAEARGQGPFRVHVDPSLQPALQDLPETVWVLYWMDRARRDLLVQAPRHRPPAGTFALRSPVRPNPIAMARVQVLARQGAVLEVDALDALDGTPLLDIKPWLPGVDA